MNKNNIESIYTLTPMQEGLLYHSLQDSKQYLDQYCCKLSGNVAANNLIKAWEILISENAILRTAFVWENVKDFLQVIFKNCKVDFGEYDWTNLSEKEIQDKLQLFLSNELEIGFQLDKAPLTRLALIKISENEYYFVWTIHHLIVDGMSLPQLLGQVYENYRRLCNNEQTLPHKALPFKAYVDWIKRQDRNQAANYWKEYLEGYYEPIQILNQNPLLEVSEGQEKSYSIPLEQTLVNKLQDTAKKHGLSIYQLYNLAYAMMVSKISGRKDIVYGVIVSGRPLDLVGVNDTIGIFINTVPTRMQFRDDSDLLSCLRSASSDHVKRNPFEYLPLTEIVALSAPGKELFQSLFIFENYSIEDIYLDNTIGFEITDERTRVATNYPLTWIVIPGGCTKLNILYNTSFINDSTIEEYTKQYILILEQLTLNVEMTFSQFKTLEDEETPVKLESPSSSPFEALNSSFIENAKNLALQIEEKSFTYESLDLQSDLVHQEIKAMDTEEGAGEKKVIISSLNINSTVIGILGAIKAGYMPVLLGKGLENRNSIYDKGSLILTDKDSAKRIPSKYWAKCIFIDKDSRKQENKKQWDKQENYSIMICSANGEGIISGNSLREEYEELTNKSVTIDSDVFDQNFIVLLLMNMLMKGSSLKVTKHLSAMQGDLLFTCSEKILGLEDCTKQVDIKVYLPLYDWQLNYEVLRKNLSDKGVEINLFLADLYTNKEIYCICLNNSIVRRNCTIIVDKNNNILRKESLGDICFQSDQLLQLTQVDGLKATGYRGKQKSDGSLEVSVYESRIGNIGGTYLDYKLTEMQLKRMGLAKDMIFVNRRTSKGMLKTVLYYVNKQKEIQRATESIISDFVSTLWEISSDKLNSNMDYCRMEELPYDWEGLISIRKLQEREIISTLVKEQIYNYISGLKHKEDIAKLSYVISVPQDLESDYHQILTNCSSNEENIELLITTSAAFQKGRSNSLINDEYGVSCRCSIQIIDSASNMPALDQKLQSEMEKTVATIWESVLNIKDIGIDENIFDLGGNSVAIMKVISRTLSALKVPVTIDDLINNPTISEFAALLEKYQMEPESNFVEKKPDLSAEVKASGVLASFAQQRFFVLHQYENNADIFNNVSEVVKLTGHVNVTALSKTITYLSSRHEALRTVFFMKDGVVYQRILDLITDTFSMVDFSKEDAEAKEKLVSEHLEKEFTRTFDFNDGPLFHCNLMKLANEEFIFTFVIHHIIADGWSVGIFINELMEVYQNYCLDLIPSLQKIEWQYSEYSVWQKNKLTDGIIDKQLTYWKDKLKNTTELNFPLDFERPAMQSFSGRKVTYRYPRSLMDKVSSVARNAGTTTFVVYLAALNVLLSRYSGQEDILVGAPVTKRPLKEVENTIGCFLNTLVFRNDLTGSPTFMELIKRVSQTAFQAFNNQDIPFELLVNKIGVARDLSKNPLFQIMFLFQNEPHPDKEIAGLKSERLESENKASMLDLSISMEETENYLSVLYEYNTDLFRAQTIEKISTHLERIIDILCSDANLKINDFDYMPTSERNHILYGFNNTKVTFDNDRFIHQLFEEQVEKHPEREALRFRELSLTYKELNIRINKLANYLLGIGVRKNQMIAVYMDRSIEMVVALYGILKAGAAYVPIDPDYPAERIQYMLEDSSVEVVLTQADKADAFHEYSLRTIILGEGDITSSSREVNPNIAIDEGDYAYMIYTSGSTGRPKGVINTHKGIRNRILWMRKSIPIEEKGRQMQKTPFSFDVSCGELFGALTVGACLVMAEPGGHKDMDYLIDLINREKITYIHFVPSMLKAFLYSPRISEVKGLKQVGCTGEPLTYSLVERFKQLFPGCDILNLYGPTEAAVEVSYWSCLNKQDKNIIPIGTPIANTQLYILDHNLRPVPVGVNGELYIAGDNLAAGYHNRKELTAERFIPNPFGDKTNPLMYKTGDFARYLPGGEIDFIGRIDNQVKVRGNRIELGEIEFNISTYSGISEVHVIVSKEETPRIIAYVVLEDKSMDIKARNEFVSELRQYLRKKLSEYMIPSFIMVLDEMPLLPNGKFNMKELPLPAVSRDYVTNSYQEASGDIELTLKQIWSQVLNLNEIGANDNFFEIGGHSLLIMEVHNKLKEKIDIKLTVVDMFKYPTIHSLSKYIHDMKHNGGIGKEMEEEAKNIKASTQDRRKNSARLKDLHHTI